MARIATAKNGTVEIKSPAKPEEIDFSASVIRYQGPTISKTAKSRTYGQALSAGFSPPVAAAYGISTKAPIKVLAKTMEGVEKLSQMEVLYNLGCHICQGFLYARPMSPADVERWLQDTQQGETLPKLGNLTAETPEERNALDKELDARLAAKPSARAFVLRSQQSSGWCFRSGSSRCSRRHPPRPSSWRIRGSRLSR